MHFLSRSLTHLALARSFSHVRKHAYTRARTCSFTCLKFVARSLTHLTHLIVFACNFSQISVHTFHTRVQLLYCAHAYNSSRVPLRNSHARSSPYTHAHSYAHVRNYSLAHLNRKRDRERERESERVRGRTRERERE